MKWLAIPLCLISTSASRAAEPEKPRKSNSELVREFADRDYRAREAATAELKKRPDAFDLIRTARQSPNPEVAQRAEEISGPISKLFAPTRIPQLNRFARDNLIDCFTEALVQYPDLNSTVPWQLMLDFAHSRSRDCAKQFKVDRAAMLKALPDEQYPLVVSRRPPTYAFRDDDLFEKHNAIHYRGESLKASADQRLRMLAATGNVTANWLEGVAFVNGDIEIAKPKPRGYGYYTQGFVASDGDITFAEEAIETRSDGTGAGPGVIVARGNVILPLTCKAIVIAGGNVTFPAGCCFSGAIHCGGRMTFLGELHKNTQFTSVEKAELPTGPFRFFDVSLIGLKVRPANDNSIWITGLAEDSPLVKAGLAKWDVILEVDGRIMKSLEDLRCAFRVGYVRGGAKLKVLRGQDPKELTAVFPLPEK